MSHGKMSGTDGDDDYKNNYEGDAEEELGLFGDLSSFDGLALEEENELAMEKGGMCPHCFKKQKSPRVLSCLHVLCEHCVKELLEVDCDDLSESFTGRKKTKNIITCPLCKQETSVGDRGLSSLQLDPVYLKKSASDSNLSGLICTSCKVNEEAVAKCMDCDNLLCSICTTAHRYMRCFENHKVTTFEELDQLGQGVAIRRNPNCPRHPTESFKYYCNTCQVATCTQCLNVFHLALDHRTERLSDAEARCRCELAQFSEEINIRQNSCRVNAHKLEKMLGELQHQFDAATSNIAEIHQAYISMLEKKRDHVMEELAALHSKQELSIMESCERVDRTRERIQTATRYTNLLLAEAEPVGLLQLQSSVKAQMHLLHNTASRPDDMDVLLKVESNPSRFEEAVNASYYFVNRCGSSSGIASKPVSSLGLPTPSSTPLPPSPTHSSPLEGAAMSFAHGCSSSSTTSSGGLKNDLSCHLSNVGAPPPPPDLSSLPSFNSMSSSMSMSMSNSMRNTTGLDLNLQALGSVVGSMTSIQEYNLQQLASLVGKSEGSASGGGGGGSGVAAAQTSLPPPGTPSPHPTSPFTLADLLTGDMNVNALNNLQALAQLGSHSSLGLDSMSNSTHGMTGMPLTGHRGGFHQSMGTNLGLLVNGGSPVCHNGGGPPLPPHDLLASALSAAPFVPSNLVNYGMRYKRSDISSSSSSLWRH